MKKLVLASIGMGLAVALTGCSLFTSGSGESADQGMQTIKVSDDMTHEPPADLGAVTQYALYNEGGLEFYDGIMLDAEYAIIYGDAEDTAVAAYIYYVFPDEESAKSYAQELEEYGEECAIEGSTVCETYDQAYVKDMIEMNMVMGIMEEDTAKAFAEMYAGMDDLIEYSGK